MLGRLRISPHRCMLNDIGASKASMARGAMMQIGMVSGGIMAMFARLGENGLRGAEKFEFSNALLHGGKIMTDRPCFLLFAEAKSGRKSAVRKVQYPSAVRGEFQARFGWKKEFERGFGAKTPGFQKNYAKKQQSKIPLFMRNFPNSEKISAARKKFFEKFVNLAFGVC